MKLFLGTDVTFDKYNEEYDGEEFIVQAPSKELSDEYQRAVNGAFNNLKGKILPTAWKIIMYILIIIGLGILRGVVSIFISDSDGPGFWEIYNLVPWLFLTCIGCLVVGFSLLVIYRRRVNDAFEGKEASAYSRRIDNVSRKIYEELGVPESATEVDVIGVSYTMKDDEIKPCMCEAWDTPYSTYTFRAFAADGFLYLVTLEGKFAFPLKDFKRMYSVNKKIILPFWNKSTDHNKGEFRKYRMREDNYGRIHVKSYYILELEHGGDTWRIYVPPYEKEIFERLTGICSNG